MADEKSTETVECHGEQVPVWVMDKGHKMNFDRPAYVDDDHCVPLGQMRKDECVVAPAAIYRKANY